MKSHRRVRDAKSHDEFLRVQQPHETGFTPPKCPPALFFVFSYFRAFVISSEILPDISPFLVIELAC
jgi:hypothetical protein